MKKETRKEQKEKTKELLLRIAYREFGEKGINATKTIDIAKAAGVSHGTLFLHFATREELLLNVVEEFGMKVGRLFSALKISKKGVREVLAAHLAVLRKDEPFWARVAIEGNSLPEQIRAHLFVIQSGIAHYLNEAIQTNLQEGTIRRLPLPLLLNTWLGLIQYYLINRDLFAPGQSVIEVKGEELLNYFVELINN